MVCIYCGGKTDVTNSRPQKRRNSVWRRRRCTICSAVFTSTEQVDYNTSLGFEDRTSHVVPFQRDLLFISLYEACRHRQHAVVEAGDLTDTIIYKLMNGHIRNGLVDRCELITLVSDTLGRFDNAAQVHYSAYHRL